jgi:SAM-dependent methyltransferase
MGELKNLLEAKPKLYDGPARHMDPQFGKTYFDGTRDQGYGGYEYDGRWKPVCERIAKEYGLASSNTVLDLGCGKGFFLTDLKIVRPEINVAGIEISEYAVAHTVRLVQPFVSLGSVDDLGRFSDHSFDFVSAMNTLHFLTPDRAAVALREMIRVGKENFFVQVDAYTNEIERERLLAWAPIIKTVFSVKEWLDLFQEVGYKGDYYWTFVQPLDQSKVEARGQQ